jgi:hypothetical protein
MDGCAGKDANQVDEGHLIIATLGLVYELQMHLLRRWRGSSNDERGDSDDDWRRAD